MKRKQNPNTPRPKFNHKAALQAEIQAHFNTSADLTKRLAEMRIQRDALLDMLGMSADGDVRDVRFGLVKLLKEAWRKP